MTALLRRLRDAFTDRHDGPDECATQDCDVCDATRGECCQHCPAGAS